MAAFEEKKKINENAFGHKFFETVSFNAIYKLEKLM